ncbi:peptide MFS transporter [Aquicella lusitana]|uniref:POT family proton-dependent oligopeptide transporter n=1 Tax=Aquicella lusitana TaxID=254246 RepID=A0A370GSR9_9COXI|nr:peptide MFS transporter [Aquicella lusitana]RDI46489.1 POT family proton-dependent oligopeptide transporter [Aquicella lusitana]VVC74153.1 Dipeptide and tripeptide permease A [Aquicella lusitana]
MDAVKSHHPRALPFLFFTEMWERFGFYIAQGLLVLYMTQHYGFSDDISDTISGIFAGLVYISPFVGGFLADRILGFKTSIIWGGFFLIAGYALLALSSTFALFYTALATIIVGNGLFKPNISGLLGTQYAPNDPHRDAGFTIFYIGINIGAALSGLSGYVKNAFGWNITFAMASIGLIIGLITFSFGLKYIKPTQQLKPVTRKFKYQLFLYCILAIIGLSFLLKIHSLANYLLPGAGLVLLVFLVVLTLQQNAEYRKRLLILNTLIVSSIIFWALFLQLFISANLFVDRLVDKNLFGIPLTTTVFYASESVFIILLGPLFAWSWQTLGKNDRNPSPVSKFVIGIFFAGLGFFALSTSTLYPDSAGMIHPLWVFFAYLLITIGELLLSPIGLSAVTLLAPPHLVGMMMGIWFVATGFGGLFAGMIAKIGSVPETAVTNAEKLVIYHTAFLDFAYLAFVVAIVLFFVQLLLKKLTQSS